VGKSPKVQVSNLVDRMVGKANQGKAVICGMEADVLVDSGSMITLISESLYNSLEPKPDLCDITDFNLDIVGASGNKLPYIGYIEGDILIPSILDPGVSVPILVVPDTENRQDVPGIIGTNVLRLCNNDFNHDISSLDAYRIALDAMTCTNLTSVKSTNKFPIVIHPNQVSTISGLVRNHNGISTAITEATGKPQLAGLNICPRVVSLDGEGSTARVPVRVCNITCKPIKILPNTHICSLSEVKVVDSWKPEKQSSTKPEVSSSFKNLQDLGIKVHEENLTEEQYIRAQQILGNWENIFSTSFTDIGKTDLVKHHIKLTDDKPFKQPYRRIPPSMYEEVHQHLREMLDCGAIRESQSPYCSNVVWSERKITV
jgi:hypothetical protein